MKHIKRFSKYDDSDDIDLSLVSKINSIISKDDKNINGFDVVYDRMSGTIEWTNDDYIVYATPYWESRKIIPINIMNQDGDDIDQYIINAPSLTSENNIPNFIDFYYEQIDNITTLLNKRTELKNAIRLISKSIGKDFLDSYYNIRIKDIDQDQIPDSDVNNLLTLLNDKYPHIIQSNKFNL